MKKELSPAMMFGFIAVGIVLLGAIGYTFLRPEGDISPEEKKVVDQAITQQYKSGGNGPQSGAGRRP